MKKTVLTLKIRSKDSLVIEHIGDPFVKINHSPPESSHNLWLDLDSITLLLSHLKSENINFEYIIHKDNNEDPT